MFNVFLYAGYNYFVTETIYLYDIFNIFLYAGYNYFGTETMYNGQTGEEFEAQIFIGLVYYQRLRHMVSDKYQVCDLCYLA